MDIKGKAESLIRMYHTNDPFYIAENLGIHIIYSDLGHTWGCCYTYRRIKFIHISTHVSEVNQKYTCAHELGHAVLHKGISTPYLKSHTLFSIDKIERQANTFAVEILLPDYLIKKYPSYTIECLSQSCGIPEGMEILKNHYT